MFNREGTSVYLRLILVAVWQKPTLHCETIILQLKIERKKKTKRMLFSKFGVMTPNAYFFLDLSSSVFFFFFSLQIVFIDLFLTERGLHAGFL